MKPLLITIDNHITKNYGLPTMLVKRYNKNDCWNVALALGLNYSYDQVRKMLNKYINPNGSMRGFYSQQLLVKHGYIEVYTELKTAKSFIEDTKYTNYEYIIATTGHMVYVRYGILYDAYKSDLQRIRWVFKRKISSKRKSKYDFISKEVMKSI